MNNKNEENTEEEIEFIADEENISPDIRQSIKKIKEKLRKCEEDKREYLEGWQRAKADLINYKKEEGKRFEDTLRFVESSFMEELLPTLDSFSLALAHTSSENSMESVNLIKNQLEDILKKRGLEEITANLGDEFDPAKHESIGEVESNLQTGTIAEMTQRGYIYQGRVLRPVRVRLSK